MKYLSKHTPAHRFPKGVRIHGSGGLNQQARNICSWLNLPSWCKQQYGVGELKTTHGRRVVRSTGEILAPMYRRVFTPKAHAHFTVIDATDLALLTGQRPADVLKLRRTDIRDGAIWIIQNKTGARLGIEITGELAEAITRISARPKRAVSAFLIQDENGQPLIGCVALPDKDDQHVLAAAIAGHADAIVTFNIKHFDLAPEKRTP